MKTWKVTVKARKDRKFKDDADPKEAAHWESLVGVEQETTLARKGLKTKADVEAFVDKHWKHLTYVRSEDMTPEIEG